MVLKRCIQFLASDIIFYLLLPSCFGCFLLHFIFRFFSLCLSLSRARAYCVASADLTKAITRSWLCVDFVTECFFLFPYVLRFWSFRDGLHKVSHSLHFSVHAYCVPIAYILHSIHIIWYSLNASNIKMRRRNDLCVRARAPHT